MFWKIVMVSVLAAPALIATPSYAQPPADTLDLTMVLLPEHAKGPQDITRRIENSDRKNSTDTHSEIDAAIR